MNDNSMKIVVYCCVCSAGIELELFKPDCHGHLMPKIKHETLNNSVALRALEALGLFEPWYIV